MPAIHETPYNRNRTAIDISYSYSLPIAIKNVLKKNKMVTVPPGLRIYCADRAKE